METILWWVRRDLRLHDQPALAYAARRGARLAAVFVLDPALPREPAPERQSFLFAGLRALDADLRRLGSGLTVRAGEPAAALAALRTELGATEVVAAADVSPYARQRDARVGAALTLLEGVTVFPPQAVRKADGAPYTVFTPYSKAWKALPFPEPAALAARPELFLPGAALPASEPLPIGDALENFPAGEAEALRRLEAFMRGRVFAYREARDRLDLDGTSSLSPYLRFGMLSPRLAAWRALRAAEAALTPEARQGAESFLNELIWREFYASILFHFPHVLRAAFNPALRAIAWREAPEDLRAWQAGETGFPVVDACMRQLRATGWMHNRGRMITASFLTKDLLINWQEGERWFMRQLIDGDPAANNGGWQWTAGVGTDAAPYFRIFNPVLQSKKFDPEGNFIRRWVPELAGVPTAFIHEPWRMTPEARRASACQIGVDYPWPMIDRSLTRERALAAYRAASGAR